MSKETITAEQCAELLKCTTAQVEELTRKGELPGIKFGRSWIYVKVDLLEYLAERARAEAAERRLDLQKRLKQASASLAPPVKPRRKTPPALPQVLHMMTTGAVQGQRP